MSPLQPLRVVLVAPSHIARESLRRLLIERPSLSLVGDYASVPEALTTDCSIPPEVILFVSGTPDLEVLQAHWPEATMICFGDDDASGVKAICLRAEASITDLWELLRTIQGQLWRAAKGDTPALTKREREVLLLVGDGYTNREIGEQLYISTSTVETHRLRLEKKLGLRGRRELMRYARSI